MTYRKRGIWLYTQKTQGKTYVKIEVYPTNQGMPRIARNHQQLRERHEADFL